MSNLPPPTPHPEIYAPPPCRALGQHLVGGLNFPAILPPPCCVVTFCFLAMATLLSILSPSQLKQLNSSMPLGKAKPCTAPTPHPWPGLVFPSSAGASLGSPTELGSANLSLSVLAP